MLLRNDIYYPDYNKRNATYSEEQDAYLAKNHTLSLIHVTFEKLKNISNYVNRTSKLDSFDYKKVEKIVQNDNRMLKYLRCEAVLKDRNPKLAETKKKYEQSLNYIDEIKQKIEDTRNPIQYEYHEQTPLLKPKNENDFDFGM